MGHKRDQAPPAVLLDRFHSACVLCGGREEALDLLCSYVDEGFRKGEKAFHIVDEQHRVDHLRRLEIFGIDVGAAQSAGQLEVRGWQDTFLRKGFFNQYAVLDLLEDALEEARHRGFPFTRFLVDMGWASEDRPGVADMVEFCARLNEAVPRNEASVACIYDVARFSATSIVDILRVHPVAAVGGQVRENPFHVPPHELLEELRARKRM